MNTVAEARAPKTHDLKCWPEFFDAIERGEKTFDLRVDDRDYQVGDMIVQNEFRVHVGEYTGRKVRCEITYVARGRKFETFGLGRGFVCLAIKPSRDD